MWSRGLKSLPVVATDSGPLVGCIRAETVMEAVLRRVARPAGFPEPAPAPARTLLTAVEKADVDGRSCDDSQAMNRNDKTALLGAGP
jgi:hypothetical protein